MSRRAATWLTSGAAAVVIGLVATGCGGGAGQARASASGPGPGATPSVTAAPGSAHAVHPAAPGQAQPRVAPSRASSEGTGPAVSGPSGSVGSSGSIGSSAGTSGSGSPSDASVPGAAVLEAALLTRSEVGPGFSVDHSSDSSSGTFSGCQPLSALLNDDSTAPGELDVGVAFQAGMQSGNPVAVTEGLIAEPVGQMRADYKDFAGALSTCRTLGFPIDSATTLRLALSPITFATGTAGARLDGAVSGVPVSGYLVLEQVRPAVALVYFYFQAGSGSSQQAYELFSKAEQKANHTLPVES